MIISYEIINEENTECIRELVDELMMFQKSKAKLHSEFFDGMNYESRLLPSLKSAKQNHIIIAKDGEEVIGYAYSTIASKFTYTSNFATLKCEEFFSFASVDGEDVGCLSQFYLKPQYRGSGVGSTLFAKSMEWLRSMEKIKDMFIFVSNGNEDALKFYLKKGFKQSHDIMDGFITVLRDK